MKLEIYFYENTNGALKCPILEQVQKNMKQKETNYQRAGE